VNWNPRAHAVPTLTHVPEESVVFHWHGDTFSVPAGTVPLASSAACANQGFATPDGRMIGLQFHLSDAATGEAGPAAATGRAFLDHWRGAMRGHFADEEDVLFPAAEPGQPEAVARLREEHAELAGLVAHLEQALVAGEDPRALLPVIGWLIHDHVRCEECVLFGQVAADVGPAGLASVGRALLERRAARGLVRGESLAGSQRGEAPLGPHCQGKDPAKP
jgi:hypothetical protein